MRTSSVLLLAAALLFYACTPEADHAPDGPTVLAAETFLADIARNVAGDRMEVGSILAPGVDPHEFQITPREAARLAEADLLIVNGRGYEAWLQKSLEAIGGSQVLVEASAGLPAGPDVDPHLWMSPRNVIQYVENIQEALSQLDPAGRSEYAANAQAYNTRLQELDAWIEAEVAKVAPERRILITNHDALEAFAEAYGFDIAGVIIPSYTSGAASSAQSLTALIQTIQAASAPAIFLDVSENSDLAQQVALESGARVVTGLYVETLSDADGPAATYIDMMKYDVRLIVDALR